MGRRDLLEARDAEPIVLTFRLKVEAYLRQALQFILVGDEVFGRYGEWGFDPQFLDLFDVREKVDYQVLINVHGWYLGVGNGRDAPMDMRRAQPITPPYRGTTQ